MLAAVQPKGERAFSRTALAPNSAGCTRRIRISLPRRIPTQPKVFLKKFQGLVDFGFSHSTRL